MFDVFDVFGVLAALSVVSVLAVLSVSVPALGGRVEAVEAVEAVDGVGEVGGDPTTGIVQPLQIYAVPRLAEAFRELALAGACPRTVLPEFVLADTATLAQLVEHGARADVLATDDAATMERLAAAGRIDRARPFATASPQAVPVSASSPSRIPTSVSTSTSIATSTATSYWIAPARGAGRPAEAADFVERVLSDDGQARLQRCDLSPFQSRDEPERRGEPERPVR
ncbi:MAG: substrate-binding domain-containing protein [Myxococcota bacterium]|nr:substrate-binding domain-containing protein [Myxococcota bacterium]